jgi:hypothetical protein
MQQTREELPEARDFKGFQRFCLTVSKVPQYNSGP